MIDLNRLRAAQSQLFLTEVAGLLHNLGKLHGDFLVDEASDRDAYVSVHPEFDYNFKRADDAAKVIRFRIAEALIKTEQDRRQLVRSLLSDTTLWSGEESTAKNLLKEWDRPSRTSQNIKRIARNLRRAGHAIANPRTARRIAEETISALGLAKLMQIPGMDQYLDANVEQWLRNTSLKLLSEQHTLSELLLLFWDDFYCQPPMPNDQMRIGVVEKWVQHTTMVPRYLATAHGVVSGVEKPTLVNREKQSFKLVQQATAFGNEGLQITYEKLDSARSRLLGLLINANLAHYQWRDDIADNADMHLALALGDTRRPVNDVTLWDYASSIAALFKAAVAKAILEDHFVETSDLRWQLMSVRYDGLAYLGQAHHISDLLARKDALEAALEAVRALIEVEYPLGNEIYRDENGSIFVVPYVEEDGREVNLLSLPVEGDGILDTLIAQRFNTAIPGPSDGTSEGILERSPLGGEIRPLIALNRKLPDEPNPGLLGKDIRLPHAEGWSRPLLQADSSAVQRWWTEEERQGEVCTVCNLRPQGYGASNEDWDNHLIKHHRPGQFPVKCEVCKAQDRAVCYVCLERRDDRSKKWATDPTEFARTIWVDEVADDDGRLALIVGRFRLDGWLDGQLIATMQKGDSFGRIRRCWSTTHIFWKDIEKELPTLVGECSRSRLIIIPEDPVPLRSNLGPYHAYELELNGRYLSVVWDPRGNSRLITAENLDYAQKVLAIDDLEAYLTGQSRTVYEPSAHLTRRERKTLVKVESVKPEPKVYSPTIVLLAEPAVFMALVPGDKTLIVARRIKEKYEHEMGKVRDRLPLHLGLVFAPRRTPIRSILEAGRCMLNLPDRWEPWQVKAADPAMWDSNNPPTDGCRAIAFTNGATWHMPLMMGDHGGTRKGTEDKWYPHLLIRPPTVGEDLSTTQPWKHARDLKVGDTVFVRPSLFDFEFLDATARRFEISYDDAGRRRGSPTRPFLLEDLDRFDRLWSAMVKGERPLSTTQLQNLEGMLLGRITDWHGGDMVRATRDDTYRQFALDVLHRLDKSWWKALKERDEQLSIELEEAAQEGDLLDLLHLMMHILKEPKE